MVFILFKRIEDFECRHRGGGGGVRRDGAGEKIVVESFIFFFQIAVRRYARFPLFFLHNALAQKKDTHCTYSHTGRSADVFRR